MQLGHGKMLAMLARIFRVILNAINGLVAGVRWLARQTYRQRSLGVSATPHLTGLLDLHAVTVGAHVALATALVVVRPTPTLSDWLLALPTMVILGGLGIWRRGRLALALLVLLQIIGLIVVALWIRQPIVLTSLVAVAIAQQATLIAAWKRHTASFAPLFRATSAGLLLGVFTGSAGFLVGLFISSFPLWLATALLVTALALAGRMPRPQRDRVVPRQTTTRKAVPDGYTVYKPSSLDEPS